MRARTPLVPVPFWEPSSRQRNNVLCIKITFIHSQTSRSLVTLVRNIQVECTCDVSAVSGSFRAWSAPRDTSWSTARVRSSQSPATNHSQQMQVHVKGVCIEGDRALRISFERRGVIDGLCAYVKGNRTLGASSAEPTRHYRLLDEIMIPFGLRCRAAVIA